MVLRASLHLTSYGRIPWSYNFAWICLPAKKESILCQIVLEYHNFGRFYSCFLLPLWLTHWLGRQSNHNHFAIYCNSHSTCSIPNCNGRFYHLTILDIVELQNLISTYTHPTIPGMSQWRKSSRQLVIPWKVSKYPRIFKQRRRWWRNWWKS